MFSILSIIGHLSLAGIFMMLAFIPIGGLLCVILDDTTNISKRAYCISEIFLVTLATVCFIYGTIVLDDFAESVAAYTVAELAGLLACGIYGDMQDSKKQKKKESEAIECAELTVMQSNNSN